MDPARAATAGLQPPRLARARRRRPRRARHRRARAAALDARDAGHGGRDGRSGDARSHPPRDGARGGSVTGVIIAAAVIAVPALAFTLWPLVARRGGSGVLPIPANAREQLL